jgi:transposase
MSKGSGLSRSERRRNARKERLRALVPRGGAVVGIDLGEDKQALALVDHDVRVLWRKTYGGRGRRFRALSRLCNRWH